MTALSMIIIATPLQLVNTNADREGSMLNLMVLGLEKSVEHRISSPNLSTKLSFETHACILLIFMRLLIKSHKSSLPWRRRVAPFLVIDGYQNINWFKI